MPSERGDLHTNEPSEVSLGHAEEPPTHHGAVLVQPKTAPVAELCTLECAGWSYGALIEALWRAALQSGAVAAAVCVPSAFMTDWLVGLISHRGHDHLQAKPLPAESA